MVMRVCLNDDERGLLGSATALLLIEGIIPPTLLSGLTQDHLIKDGVYILYNSFVKTSPIYYGKLDLNFVTCRISF